VRNAKWVFSPLDEQLGLKDKRYSEGVFKEMTWLSGAVDSFAEAEQVFLRIGHLSISDSSIWRRKEEWGERFKEVEEAERKKANTLGSANRFREQVLGSEKRIGVSMDGTMVHIRDEGWKELKVGCSFDIDVFPTWNKETQEYEDLAHAVNNRYVAHLGGPERLGQLLWSDAKQRGWERAKDKQAVADAAPWIWNLVQDHFYDARQAVDWYHATDHLADVAKWMHGEETAATKKWYKAAQKQLYQGHAQQIANELRKNAPTCAEHTEDLEREANFFENNKRRMQYLELREDGFVIGSGMVESGCKQYKARFCGPGMRWSRDGIGRLIPIRSMVMGGCFDTTWQTAYNLPQN
jgi:hypothetical protein